MGQAGCEKLAAAGYEAICRLSAAEGLVACQEREPALVISEYCLGEGGSGLDFLRKLGRLNKRPPVVIATGRGREEVAARALALGAYAYELKDAGYLERLPQIVARALEEAGRRERDQAREQALGRQRSQNELAGWLAHNFKNILAASIGYLNLIDFDNPAQDGERRRQYLAQSIEGQESAIDLLEQLSRLTEAGGEKEIINVGDLVAECWEAARLTVLSDLEKKDAVQAEHARIRIGQMVFFNSARRLPPVQMVRQDLRSVMKALLQNALEAVLPVEDPRILVLGENVDGRLELTVRDNGRGMSEEVIRHAAEPLFSTKGEVGVGLSLGLVSSIATRYGGELSFKSSPGAGTSVKITLTV